MSQIPSFQDLQSTLSFQTLCLSGISHSFHVLKESIYPHSSVLSNCFWSHPTHLRHSLYTPHHFLFPSDPNSPCPNAQTYSKISLELSQYLRIPRAQHPEQSDSRDVGSNCYCTWTHSSPPHLTLIRIFPDPEHTVSPKSGLDSSHTIVRAHIPTICSGPLPCVLQIHP